MYAGIYAYTYVIRIRTSQPYGQLSSDRRITFVVAPSEASNCSLRREQPLFSQNCRLFAGSGHIGTRAENASETFNCRDSFLVTARSRLDTN